MNILKKLIIFFIITVLFVNILSSYAFASSTLDNIVSDGDSFISAGKMKADGNISEEELKGFSSTIYSVLLIIGTILAIIVGLILGIKFIAGSVEEQADVKKMLVPYVIGVVVVFGAFTIWKLLVDILQTI